MSFSCITPSFRLYVASASQYFHQHRTLQPGQQQQDQQEEETSEMRGRV